MTAIEGLSLCMVRREYEGNWTPDMFSQLSTVSSTNHGQLPR